MIAYCPLGVTENLFPSDELNESLHGIFFFHPPSSFCIN